MKIAFFKTASIIFNTFNGNLFDLQNLHYKLHNDLNEDITIQKYYPTIKTEYRVKTSNRILNKIVNKKRIPRDRLGMRIIYDTTYNDNEFLAYYIMNNIERNFDYSFHKKDYITNPKPNNYQSLHINVYYEDKYYEIQIRNKDMDNVAKYGSAANYK